MAQLICNCGDGFGNSGLLSCVKKGKARTGIYLQQRFASDGTENYIDLTSALDQAYFTTLLNETEDKRLIPIMEVKNLTAEKGDPTFQTFEDGSMEFVKDNPRAFTMLIPKMGNHTSLKAINQGRCIEMCAYEIDAEGKIFGMQRYSETDKLYGIAIEKNSMYSQLVYATDSTVEHLALRYQYGIAEIEENIAYISGESLNADFNPNDQRGLLDAVMAAATNISTTGFKVAISSLFGDLGAKEPITDLVAANFTLAEVTPTPGAITITSVTESPDGTYTFVIPSQTSGDVLRLTPDRDGYDFDPATINITIP